MIDGEIGAMDGKDVIVGDDTRKEGDLEAFKVTKSCQTSAISNRRLKNAGLNAAADYEKERSEQIRFELCSDGCSAAVAVESQLAEDHEKGRTEEIRFGFCSDVYSTAIAVESQRGWDHVQVVDAMLGHMFLNPAAWYELALVLAKCAMFGNNGVEWLIYKVRNVNYVEILRHVAEVAEYSGIISSLVTEALDTQRLLIECSRSHIHMVRFFRVLEVLLFNDKAKNERKTRFLSLLSETLRFLATEEGSRGDESLLHAVNAFFLHQSWAQEWVRHRSQVEKMFLNHYQEFEALKTLSVVRIESLGFLSGWCLLWLGLALYRPRIGTTSDLDHSSSMISIDLDLQDDSQLVALRSCTSINSWIMALHNFCERLTRESLWEYLDLLASKILLWIKIMNGFPACSVEFWEYVGSILEILLKRTGKDTAIKILKGLTVVANQLPDQVDRMLFMPNSSIYSLVARGVALEQFRDFYICFATDERIKNALRQILVYGQPDIGKSMQIGLNPEYGELETWTVFLISVAAMRRLDILCGTEDVSLMLTKLAHNVNVQVFWIHQFLKQCQLSVLPCSKVDEIIRFAVKSGNRRLVYQLLSDSWCSESINASTIDSFMDPNRSTEDCIIRKHALLISSSLKNVLDSLSDVNSSIRDVAIRKLANFPTTLFIDGQSVECTGPSKYPIPALFTLTLRVVDNFLRSASEPNYTLELFQWITEAIVATNSSILSSSVAHWIAEQLVVSKLCSVYGSSAETLKRLSLALAMLRTRSEETRQIWDCLVHGSLGFDLSSIMTSFENFWFCQLLVKEMYFLEIEICKAFEGGALIRATERESISGNSGSTASNRTAAMEAAFTFFHSNINVWSGWSVKYREQLMSYSARFSLSIAPEVLWHGWNGFIDGTVPLGKFLFSCCRSFIGRRDETCPLDLVPWIRYKCSQNLSAALELLLKAVSKQAIGSLEQAAPLYRESFDKVSSLCSETDMPFSLEDSLLLSGAIEFSVEGAIDCLASLSRWDDVDGCVSCFKDRVKNMPTNVSMELRNALDLKIRNHLIYAEARKSFEKSELQLCREALNKFVVQDLWLPEDVLKAMEMVVLYNASGTSSSWSRQKIFDGVLKLASEHIHEISQQGLLLEYVDDFRGMLWAVKLSLNLTSKGDDAAHSFSHMIPRLSRRCLETLSVVYRNCEAEMDCIFLAKVRKGLKCGDIQYANSSLLQVVNKNTLSFLESKVACDFASKGRLLDMDYVLKAIECGKVHTREDAAAIFRLCRLVACSASCDDPKKYLKLAFDYAGEGDLDIDELDESCWIDYAKCINENTKNEDDLVKVLVKLICRGSSARGHHHMNSKSLYSFSETYLRILELMRGRYDDAALSIVNVIPLSLWLPYVSQLLSEASCGEKVASNIILSLAREFPKRVIWDIVTSISRLPTSLVNSVRRVASPYFDTCVLIVEELCKCAVLVEEKGEVLLEKIISKRKSLMALNNRYINSDFEERDILLKQFRAIISAFIDAIETLCSKARWSRKPSKSSPLAIDNFFDHEPMDSFFPESELSDGKENIERGLCDSHTRRLHCILLLLKNCFNSPFDSQILEKAFHAAELEIDRLRNNRKTNCKGFKLSLSAPYLLDFPNAIELEIPGVENVQIESFLDKMVTLNTKNKPKRIWIRGSDGKEYGYLLKGGEDLRLDQKVMQLCGIVDSVRSTHTQKGNLNPSFRTYEVLPLNQSVGLIRWIDSAVPLLSIYQNWHRNVVNSKNGSSVAPASGAEYVAVIEEFMQKYSEDGQLVTGKVSRQEAMKMALKKCSDLVPADLLSRKLWLTARDANSWWNRSRNFALSAASSGILGHIVGLGDRHLGNILIDLSADPSKAGQLINIDYAVCFDKGAHLGVPETVPFRLTRVMRGCLPFHYMRTENSDRSVRVAPGGTFMSHCESVLSACRQKKELICMLVRNLLNDQTIEWTSDSNRGNPVSDLRLSTLESKSSEEIDQSEFADRLKWLCARKKELLSLVKLHQKARNILICELRDDLENLYASTVDETAFIERKYEDMAGVMSRIEHEAIKCREISVKIDRSVEMVKDETFMNSSRDRMITAYSAIVNNFNDFGKPESTVVLTNQVASLSIALQGAMDSIRKLNYTLSKLGLLEDYGSKNLVKEWIEWFESIGNMGNLLIANCKVLRNRGLSFVNKLELFLSKVNTTAETLDIGEHSGIEAFDIDIQLLVDSAKKEAKNYIEVASSSSRISNWIDSLSFKNIYCEVEKVFPPHSEQSGWDHANQILWRAETISDEALPTELALVATSRLRLVSGLKSSRVCLAESLSNMQTLLTTNFSHPNDLEFSRRNGIMELSNLAGLILRLVDGIVEMEQNSCNTRFPCQMNFEEPTSAMTFTSSASAATLDRRLFPVAEEFGKKCDSLLQAAEKLTARFNSFDEFGRTIKDYNVKIAQAVDDLVACRKQLKKINVEISDKLEIIRGSLRLDNVELWTGFETASNINRSDSAYSELLSVALKNRDEVIDQICEDNIDVPSLMNKWQSLQKILQEVKGIADHVGTQGKSSTYYSMQGKMAKEFMKNLDSKLEDETEIGRKARILIEQACDEELLCRMYEGWMPWV